MRKKRIIAGFFLAVCLMFVVFTSVSFVLAENPSGEADTTWTTGGWWCDADTDHAYWKNGGSKVTNNCSKYASVNNNVSCCQDYKQCNPDGTCSGYAKYCYEYNNSNSCNWGIPKIVYMNNMNYTCGTTSAPDSNGCVKTYQCVCKWNSTSTSTKKCTDVLNIVTATTTNPTASCEGSGTCTWSTEIIANHCNDSLNYVGVTKKASWSGTNSTRPAGCKDMERQDTCPITVKLPFFGSFMMFISIFLVIVIYFFIDIKKIKKF